MNEGYKWKVQIVFSDGDPIVEFYCNISYDTMANGRIVYWQDVVIGGKRIGIYSVPVYRIKHIDEIELE